MRNDIWLKPSSSSFSKKTKLKLAIWLLVEASIFRYSPHKLSKFRILLLNLFGAKIKGSCFIHPRARIYMPWNLVMGELSSIDFDTMVYSLNRITLEDYVSVAYKVNINTGSHDVTDPFIALITSPVTIKSGAFIGTESYIGPGVTIGHMSVIGARSVVTKDMPPSMICFGTPCKPIKLRVNKD